MTKKLNVKEYVNKEYEKLKEFASILSDEEMESRKFTIFQVGNLPASNKYIRNKIKKLEMLGIPYEHKQYPIDCRPLNFANDVRRHKGLAMIQRPLSVDLEDAGRWLENDVDGLSIFQKCEFATNGESYIPCTAKGIRDYMKYIDNHLNGKSVLIINRSDLVGKPLSQLLLKENMLVTVAHSHIEKIKLIEMFEHYDYIVSGVGIAGYWETEDIPNGCTFIDVGINFDKDGNLCGDLNVTDSKAKDFDYTPVPGGVGQLTVLSLMKNILYGEE